MRFFARGFVSPWIDIRIGASGRFLPFGFSRQSLARTLAEFFRFLPADVRVDAWGSECGSHFNGWGENAL